MPYLTAMIFDSGLLSNSYIGVMSLDLKRPYAENMYFLVDKLKQIRHNIRNDRTKSSSLIGLDILLQQYESDLRNRCLKNLDGEDFSKRALKKSIQLSGINESKEPDANLLLSRLGQSENKIDSNKIVIEPRYQKDDNGVDDYSKEIAQNIDREKYEVLGFNTMMHKTKHYRYKVDSPLEDTDFLLSSSFISIPITSGKQLKEERSIFSRLVGGDNKHREVGKFKGTVSVIRSKVLHELKNLDLSEELTKYDLPTDPDNWRMTQIDRDIMQEVEVRVRLYIIEASINDSKDYNSASDIYTKIYLGTKLISDNKDKRIDNQQNPKFYYSCEFKATLPGTSMLKILFYDYDPIGFDEYIGRTEVDLEDRYFDRRWRDLVSYPIEKRDIRQDSFGSLEGTVKLWIEIDRLDIPERVSRPMLDISPIPDRLFELRVIIWDVDNVPINDEFEQMSDVYVKCSFPSLGI